MDWTLFEFNQQGLLEFFSQYAYSPTKVYIFIILLMTASSFGLPIPEEVTLVTAGLVAYMGQTPERFPPPYPDARPVDMISLAIVCFVAVLLSDILIYFLGKFFGKKIVRTQFFRKRIGQKRFERINIWFNKYSAWACGLFRFTPGLRFPGHMSCGLLQIPLWKFVVIDGLAALVSVPTQVILVAVYGEVILERMREIKLVVGVILGILFVFYVLPRALKWWKEKKSASGV